MNMYFQSLIMELELKSSIVTKFLIFSNGYIQLMSIGGQVLVLQYVNGSLSTMGGKFGLNQNIV